MNKGLGQVLSIKHMPGQFHLLTLETQLQINFVISFGNGSSKYLSSGNI